MRFEMDVQGVDRSSGKMKRLGVRALETKPAFEAMAEELIDLQDKQFMTGKGWARNKPSTRERKARQGHDPRPLHQTGLLDLTLTASRRRRAPGRKLSVRKGGVDYGVKGGRSPIFYGRFQGDYVKRRGGRGRKVMVKMTRADQRRMRKILQHHLMRK